MSPCCDCLCSFDFAIGFHVGLKRCYWCRSNGTVKVKVVKNVSYTFFGKVDICLTESSYTIGKTAVSQVLLGTMAKLALSSKFSSLLSLISKNELGEIMEIRYVQILSNTRFNTKYRSFILKNLEL